MPNLIEELEQRGFIANLSDPAIGELCEKEKVVVYCGFDPTADSLHVGNFLPIMLLSHFQRAGHTPIALVGGATGLIGDPSGKKDERTLLSREDVRKNAEGIKNVLSRFLSFEGNSSASIVNNLDWIGEFSFVDFIRDVGKHVRITEMLARDSVKSRLDTGGGLSFTEFSYQILQAYDFYHLFRERGCKLQAGGADQWGNITAGTDLIRRLLGERAYGMVAPLLTTATGQKFGKTEEGAIWLTPDRTSPYQFYQYWIRTDDQDVLRFLKLFTFLSLDEIDEVEKEFKENPDRREAQKRLAWEVTCLVHGPEAARSAVNASQALFGGSLEGLDGKTLESVFADVPSFSIAPGRIEEGLSIVDALTESGLASSKGEARRLIKGGGVYLNNNRIDDQNLALGKDHLLAGGLLVLRSGKKKYCLGRVC